MSDPLREALSTQLKALPESTPAMQAHWPIAFDRVALHEFQPFGVVDIAAMSVTTEWLFLYDRLDPTFHEVRAMFTGQLSWSAGDSILQLESLHYPSDILNLVDDEWPQWMPIARVIAYRYLEPVSLRQAVTAIVAGLSSADRIAIDAKTPDIAGMPADQVADRFLNPNTPWPATDVVLPVRSGTALGNGELAGLSNRLALRGRERVQSTFYVNLAYHTHALLKNHFLSDPPLSMAAGADIALVRKALIDSNGPVIASGNVKTVAPANATHTSVHAAVTAAAPGDLVLVTDTSVHQSPNAIVVDKPLVISSTSTADARTTSVGLPKLRGVKPAGPRNVPTWAPASRRVFEVVGRRNGQSTIVDGLVQISNLCLDQSAAPYGGAIWVNECDRVLIDNVRFEGNEAFGGGWLYEGFGGAVGTRHSGILVRRSGFLNSAANCRGGALGVFGYGWPVIVDCEFESNRSAGLGVQNPDTGRPFLERPDGGAIGLQMATPNTESVYSEVALFVQRSQGKSKVQIAADALGLSIQAQALFAAMAGGSLDDYWDKAKLAQSRRNAVVISRCVFLSNTSQDDGGGVYATGLVRARLRDCRFETNKADSNGGGLRISTVCDVAIHTSTFTGNESNGQNRGYRCIKNKDNNDTWTWINVGGGAIASRTSNLKLVDTTLTGNKANRYAGGAIFFTSTDEGNFPGGFSWLKNDWNSVREILSRCGSQVCPEFREFTLSIEGGSIRDNACGWTSPGSPTTPPPAPACGAPPSDWNTRDQLHGKGGGIYALRHKDESVVYPAIKVSIAVGSTLFDNVAAYSPGAVDLFIADLNGATGAQNPAADSGALVRDPAGALTAALQFVAAP